MFINENQLLDQLKAGKNVLLLDPANQKKYIPLGLAKIATYVKSHGGNVTFQRKYKPVGEDLVCISSLFTWNSHKVHESINDVLKVHSFTGNPIKVLVGGVYVALMPKRCEELNPQAFYFKGCSKILDEVKPDYSIDYLTDKKFDNVSYIYTSRGCVNRCPYCSAWRIEPEQYKIENWKQHIDLNRNIVMINDNNLSSQNLEFLKEIFGYIKENKLLLNIKNGFDVKYVTDEMASMLGQMKFDSFGMKLSFDRIEEDGLFQETIKKLIRAGVPKSKIMIYVLYNFTEEPREAVYRMTECIKLKVTPHPQRYTTMSVLDIHDKYLGKHWTPNLRDGFKFFYTFGGYYRNMTFHDWCKNTGKNNNTKTFTKAELNVIKE